MALLFSVIVAPLLSAHGDLHGQIEAVTKEIERDPKNARLHFKRAELHRFHEEGAAALADLDRAAELDPSLAIVDLARGKTWLDARKGAEAKDAFDRFLLKQPDHADALIHRARALVLLGERLAAAADYTRALVRHAQPQPDHYVERARALAAAGPDHVDDALRGLDEAMEKLGAVTTLQLAGIDIAVAAKRFDAALERLDRLPRQASWLVRRGEILRTAGREGEARAAFQAALQAIEDLPPARRAVPATKDLENRARGALEVSDARR